MNYTYTKGRDLMASARKLPSGNYRVNLFVGLDENGKRKYKSFTAPTKKEAELMAAQYNIDRKEKPKCQLTVKEAAERFISDHSHVLAPSTLRGYTNIMKNNMAKISQVKLSDLSQEKVQAWVNQLSKDHSPKTVDNIYAFLSSILSEFMPDFHMTITLPQKQKTMLSVPQDEEVEALIAYFDKEPYVQAAIMLAAVVGMRRGEICALEWGDIDDSKIYVTKALSMNAEKTFVVKTPKTFDGMRVLIIPKSLEKRLLSMKKPDRKDERIFHFTPNALTDRFVKARKKLGFSWRFHDLRHYNASVMLSIGVPDKYAMKRMGHATTNMLKTVYQHTFSKREIEVADAINTQMERLIK